MKKQLFALALVTAAGCFLAGCNGIAVITGNGIITEKTFDPGDISRLTTAGYWKITLDPNADRNQCTIVIDENLLEELAIKSGSGRLQVTPLHNLRPSREPQLRLQLKQMPEKLNFSGISNLEVTGKLTRETEWSFSGSTTASIPGFAAPEIQLQASGISRLTLGGNVEKATVRTSGSTEFTFNGNIGELHLEQSGCSSATIRDCETARKMTVHSSGSSNFTFSGNLQELFMEQSGCSNAAVRSCESAEIQLSGSCTAKLDAARQLTVRAGGASQLLYSGSPELQVHTSGSAKIKKQKQ